MYEVQERGSTEIQKFYTPDGAHEAAKKAKNGAIIRSGGGLDKSVRACAKGGRLYDAKTCERCGGKGKVLATHFSGYGSYTSHDDCSECSGLGVVPGKELGI